MDVLIAGSEAARMLGVSRATVTRWIRAGRLCGYVLNRTTRVWLSSLETMLGTTAVKRAAAVARKEGTVSGRWHVDPAGPKRLLEERHTSGKDDA
jgi:excisionase family DNA binding protein